MKIYNKLLSKFLFLFKILFLCIYLLPNYLDVNNIVRFFKRYFPCRHNPRKSFFLLKFFLKIMKPKNIYLYQTFTFIITLVQNSISYEKFPGEIFHKNAQISTYSPKTELKRSFPTPSGVTFVQNSISYKKISQQNFS